MKWRILKKKKFWTILGFREPVVLAFAASLLVFFIFPFDFHKYSLELKNSRRFQNNEVQITADVDNNGYSDNIVTVNNSIGNAAVSIQFLPSMKAYQWNFPGRFTFEDNNFLFTADYNHDKKLEIYCFVISNDSVFINTVDYFDKATQLRSFFLSKVGVKNDKTDAKVIPCTSEDIDNDGYNEIIFGLTCGFSIYPRRIFALDVKKGVVTESPCIGDYMFSIRRGDLNGDKKPEFIPLGYAPDNMKDSSCFCHDHSSWLIVLDNRLQFFFKPEEFPGTSDIITPLLIPSGGKDNLALLCNYLDKEKRKLKFIRYDSSGNKILEKPVNDLDPTAIQGIITEASPAIPIAISTADGEVNTFDTALEITGKIHLSFPLNWYSATDVDDDGKKEFLAADFSSNKLHILRNDFSQDAEIVIPFGHSTRTNFSVLKSGDEKPMIFMTSGESSYLLEYKTDIRYYTKWLIYPAIFLSIYLFTLIVRKIQIDQIRKKELTGKKITELQLTIVKNQIDPHFTMNAINSVLEAINNNDKEAASKYLMHFSKLYRFLVLSGDKFRVSLEDEINFTENYIELQKYRFGDRFEYRKIIGMNVDFDWEVPKMVIQAHVENAIKHGLMHKKSGGVLNLELANGNHSLIITIEDNGIGRTMARRISGESTGKGFEILKQYYELYYTITGSRITYEINDLYDENNPAGTRVILYIPFMKKNRDYGKEQDKYGNN